MPSSTAIGTNAPRNPNPLPWRVFVAANMIYFRFSRPRVQTDPIRAPMPRSTAIGISTMNPDPLFWKTSASISTALFHLLMAKATPTRLN